MEYRVFIQIPGVPLADEDSWERLIGWLESTDAEDAAAAAEVASSAVTRALHATDLGTLYPRAIEVEQADAKEPMAA